MSQAQVSVIEAKLALARQEFLDLITPFSESEWQVVVFSEGDQWTVADILRHLTGAEASMTRLAEIIRDGGEGAPPDFDLQRWNARGIKKSKAKDPQELIEEMSANRIKLFTFIDGLEPDDWSKSGRHGSLQIMSIEEILNQIANHESQHTLDIRKALGVG